MSKQEERSMWVIGLLLIVLAIPLEGAMIWAIWKMGVYTIPFFFAVVIFFMFVPEQSRSSFMRASPPFVWNPDTVPCPPPVHYDDLVIIPPPPLLPTEWSGRTGSTMPSAPYTLQEFEDVAKLITSRPPPAIN